MKIPLLFYKIILLGTPGILAVVKFVSSDPNTVEFATWGLMASLAAGCTAWFLKDKESKDVKGTMGVLLVIAGGLSLFALTNSAHGDYQDDYGWVAAGGTTSPKQRSDQAIALFSSLGAGILIGAGISRDIYGAPS